MIRSEGRGGALCPSTARAAVALACALSVSAPIQADGLSGGVGLVSDKVVRGMSQSGAQPSLLIDLVYRSQSRWSISLGAASLGLGGLADNGRDTGSDSELYLAVTRSWQLDDDWNFQLGSTGYVYPGSRDPFYGNYLELGGSVSWRGALSLALATAPSISGKDRSGRSRRGATAALELGGHLPLRRPWAFDAGLGWHDVSGLGNRPYPYGSIGVSWRGGSTQAFVTYITSQADERNGVSKRIAGDRAVLALWWSF